MHQILHVALLHAQRLQGREKLRWNLACDYVINQMVLEEQRRSKGKIQMPPNVLLDSKYQNKSVEQVYEMLPSNLNDLVSNYGEFNLNDLENAQQDTTFLFDLLQEIIDLNENEIRDIQSALLQAVTLSQQQGTMPLGIKREIDALLYPKVDWRILLKEFIQSFPSDWDFSNRDRRFLQTNFILPQFSGEQVKVGVAIDTSGSIGQDILNAFMSETYSIFSAYENVEMTMFCVDARVQSRKVVHSLDEALDFTIKGGGGTDFRKLFKQVEEEESFDALIFFTDMYATFPQDEPYIKTLWISTSDKKAPFGKTIFY